MTKLMYRGVAYDTEQKPAPTLAEQMRKKDLVYRGIAHDGVRPVETAPAFEHVYRGVRFI
ncbi:MAG: DUF4278 domain-containing protein [Henriciella sp.]|nr:DUF4278 domain-containing protein [Henriciella sp.]